MNRLTSQISPAAAAENMASTGRLLPEQVADTVTTEPNASTNEEKNNNERDSNPLRDRLPESITRSIPEVVLFRLAFLATETIRFCPTTV